MGRGGNLVKYVTVICLPIAGEIFLALWKLRIIIFGMFCLSLITILKGVLYILNSSTFSLFIFKHYIAVLNKHDLPGINWFPLAFASLFDIETLLVWNDSPIRTEKWTFFQVIKHGEPELKMGTVLSYFGQLCGHGNKEGEIRCT